MNLAAKTALLAFACCLFEARTPHAAPTELKLQVQLDAGVIKVADLWQNAGKKGEMTIGPAPPPGRTIAIETGQLVYIARLYDVDWRPTSGVERILIERAGRPLVRDELTDPIRRSLIDAGASPSATLEIGNFDPILVPRLSFPQFSVEAVQYDAITERFSINLVASAEGMQTQRSRVTGRIIQMVTAVVATRRLQPGELIGPNDVRATQVGERHLAGPVVSDVAQVLGQAPKRTVLAGQAFAVSDIGAPIMIAKGATVVMLLETPGLSLSAQGLALGAGGRDDIIQVMNPVSRAVVAARVTGPGTAVIAPGAPPLAPTPGVISRASEVAN